MTVEVTQYMRPDGRKVPMLVDVDDSCAEAYKRLQATGSRLTAEHTGALISLTVEDAREDLDAELVPNGPEVIAALERMIKRFEEKRCTTRT